MTDRLASHNPPVAAVMVLGGFKYKVILIKVVLIQIEVVSVFMLNHLDTGTYIKSI